MSMDKGKRKRWSQIITVIEAARICQRCKAGEYFCEVGREYKLTPTLTIAVLRDHGYGEYFKWKHYGRKGSHIKWTNSNLHILYKLWKEGLDDDQIAQRMYASGQGIAKARSVYGYVSFKLNRKKGIKVEKKHDHIQYTVSNALQRELSFPKSNKGQFRSFIAVIDRHRKQSRYAPEICNQLESLTWRDILMSELNRYPTYFRVEFMGKVGKETEDRLVTAYYQVVHIDMMQDIVEFRFSYMDSQEPKKAANEAEA